MNDGKEVKMKQHLRRELSRGTSTVILVLVFLAGLLLVLYPTISDYWNSFHTTRAIASYAETVYTMDDEEYARVLQQAYDYNAALAESGTKFFLTPEQKVKYASCLDITGSGIMAYIDIPSIDVSLPVYHGTEESTLQSAVGHVEWTSLPVGGLSTHSVLSGHRGLPSAKLFTNLDKLTEGDVFMIRVLNETVTYMVDQIRIVLPDEVNDLVIERGKEYCTLITCTPYGINTHRLLVRGHRIENAEDTPKLIVVSDASQIEPAVVAVLMAAAVLLLLSLIVVLRRPRRPGTGRD